MGVMGFPSMSAVSGFGAQASVGHGGDEGFAVVDFSLVDETQEFGERDEHDFEALVLVEAGYAGRETFSEENLHPLGKETGTGVVAGELRPLFCAEAGLFGELSFGGGETVFVGVDFAGRDFVEELSCRVAILTLEDDERVSFLCIVDGENDHGASVTDDVAEDGSAFRLVDLFLVDTKERALIGGLAGDNGSGPAGADFQFSLDDVDGFGLLQGLLWRHSLISVSFSYGTSTGRAGNSLRVD